MTSRELVLQDALALAPEDRAFVVNRLEQSLLEQTQEKSGCVSPEIAAAWAQEIERRVAAYDRGEVRTEDADVVLRRMRTFLKEHRRQSAEL